MYHNNFVGKYPYISNCYLHHDHHHRSFKPIASIPKNISSSTVYSGIRQLTNPAFSLLNYYFGRRSFAKTRQPINDSQTDNMQTHKRIGSESAYTSNSHFTIPHRSTMLYKSNTHSDSNLFHSNKPDYMNATLAAAAATPLTNYRKTKKIHHKRKHKKQSIGKLQSKKLIHRRIKKRRRRHHRRIPNTTTTTTTNISRRNTAKKLSTVNNRAVVSALKRKRKTKKTKRLVRKRIKKSKKPKTSSIRRKHRRKNKIKELDIFN